MFLMSGQYLCPSTLFSGMVEEQSNGQSQCRIALSPPLYHVFKIKESSLLIVLKQSFGEQSCPREAVKDLQDAQFYYL